MEVTILASQSDCRAETQSRHALSRRNSWCLLALLAVLVRTPLPAAALLPTKSQTFQQQQYLRHRERPPLHFGGSTNKRASSIDASEPSAAVTASAASPSLTETLLSPTSGLSLILSSNALDTRQFFEVMRHAVELQTRHVVKLVYVPTASMFLDPDSTSAKSLGERRSRARASMRKKMKAIETDLNQFRTDNPQFALPEVQAEWLDLAAVDSRDEVVRAMHGTDAVYIEGGNTWFLAHHVRRTDFEAELLNLSSAVYVGISAGAIMAGRSLATTLWKGWDKPIDEIDVGDASQLEGMNLAGGLSFFPHHTSDWDEVVATQGPQLDHEFVLLEDQRTPSPVKPKDWRIEVELKPARGSIPVEHKPVAKSTEPCTPADVAQPAADGNVNMPVASWVFLSPDQDTATEG